MTARFLVGTSGWDYPHWRDRFYPAGLPRRAWLGYYARRFRTVEVNNTFYRLPESRTFAQWRSAVPGSFMFGVKASRFITHITRLRLSRGPVRRLLVRARGLGRGLGPILFQLPPNFGPDEPRLERFLKGLPPGHGYAIEFRHAGWHRPSVYRLLRRRGGACASPMDRMFRSGRPDRPIRLRALPRSGRHRRRAVRKLCAPPMGEDPPRSVSRGTAYVYFNNDQAGYAVQNAMRLTDLLKG